MDSGWSLKQLHRLIVTSATYRQSSRVTPELLAQATRTTGCSPAGRGSGSRPRSSATSPWRPAACSTRRSAGRACSRRRRRSCSSRRPATGRSTGPRRQGADRYRRALYTFRCRSMPYPVLQTFDAPNGDASCVRRTRSNTPLQALTTLNEPIFVECARALGKRRCWRAARPTRTASTFAFRRCVARKPTADELAVLSGLLDKYKKRFADAPATAAEVATGEKRSRSPTPRRADIWPSGPRIRWWPAWC